MSAAPLTTRKPAASDGAARERTGRDRSAGEGRARRGSLDWMVLPALLFFAVFAVLPLLGVVALSFTNWDGIGAISMAGADNWLAVLSDPVMYNAVWLTFVIMVVSWLVQTPISLLLGTFTAGSQKYRAVLAVLYFLPLLLSSAAIAIAYKALLDPNFGLAEGLGLPFLAQDWLGQPQLVLFLVIFVIAWQFAPFHTLIYQGGVRQIPKSLYEAAEIDGAGRVKQFFYITVPQLKYTIITSSTLMVVGSLTYFDLIFVLTAGGPGNSTRILALDMYLTGFRANLMGPASVIAVILVAVGLGLALLLQRLGGKNSGGSQLEGL
jgi:raffinose/stachyose/melibiose transport system permease protein